MSSKSSLTVSDGFNVGNIVWGRHSPDGIYWPGKITFISNNLSDSNVEFLYQPWSYLVHFFGHDQANWTVDVLPYRQYRDYMSKTLLVHYDTYPQIKYQFLNAMNQADYADVNGNSIKSNDSTSRCSYKTNNYNYIPPLGSGTTVARNSTPCTTSEYPLNYCSYYPSNWSYNTQLCPDSYCSTCTHSSSPLTTHLSIENNSNNDYHEIQNDTTSTQTENLQKLNSVVIITTKSYSNSSLISYLFNCLSNFFYHSVIYIDDLTNYQHPTTTSNIYYLICLDHFHLPIQQILDSTILNNLNPHMNYLFLIINSPSNDLIKHCYSRIMDKRMILIVQYQSTFDNEALLLCSGNRRTYEMNRTIILKYLCSNVKYIESNNDEEERLYSTENVPCASHIKSIKEEPIVHVPNQTSELNSATNYQNSISSCLSLHSIMKSKKKLGRRKLINTLGKKHLKHKSKHRLSKNKTQSALSSEYYVTNILDTFNSS